MIFIPLWINFVCAMTVFWPGDPEDVGTLVAKNKTVVDRSDLIPKVLILNVGDEFCGMVAHVRTPEDFFCQQLQNGRKCIPLTCVLPVIDLDRCRECVETHFFNLRHGWSLSADKLAELQASLSEYCGQVSPRSDFYPAIGDICCARFSGKERDCDCSGDDV